MMDYNVFLRLFAAVLQDEKYANKVYEKDIRIGVRDMAALYAPQPLSLHNESVNVPNYNLPSHRCAYLHKYAAFHSALVYDMMMELLTDKNHSDIFNNLVMSNEFKLCSIGGGPGCDAIGALTALSSTFGPFKINITIVDLMIDWKKTFACVIGQLSYGYGNYGLLHTIADKKFLTWNYIEANLLGSMSSEVNKAISSANFLTMVKFVSASACQDSDAMIKKIFNVMKPGALILFIDNAAGGFHEVIVRAASHSGMKTMFGPYKHYSYINENTKSNMFGYTSCFETKVTIHLLQKLLIQNINQNINYRHPNKSNQNAIVLAPTSLNIASTSASSNDNENDLSAQKVLNKSFNFKNITEQNSNIENTKHNTAPQIKVNTRNPHQNILPKQNVRHNRPNNPQRQNYRKNTRRSIPQPPQGRVSVGSTSAGFSYLPVNDDNSSPDSESDNWNSTDDLCCSSCCIS